MGLCILWAGRSWTPWRPAKKSTGVSFKTVLPSLFPGAAAMCLRASFESKPWHTLTGEPQLLSGPSALLTWVPETPVPSWGDNFLRRTTPHPVSWLEIACGFLLPGPWAGASAPFQISPTLVFRQCPYVGSAACFYHLFPVLFKHHRLCLWAWCLLSSYWHLLWLHLNLRAMIVSPSLIPPSIHLSFLNSSDTWHWWHIIQPCDLRVNVCVVITIEV